MQVRAMVSLAFLTVALMLVASAPLAAQTCSPSQYTNKLICTVPQLFGPQGLQLNNPNHNAHFKDNSESQFRPLNQAIGQELSILPLGSSASSSVTFDSQGHPIATEDSLGPILTERATVVGKKAYTLGAAYQYFSFDKIDGINLHNFPAVLLHEGSFPLSAITSPYQNDYITTTNNAHLSLNQTVLYAVVGLSKHMDASIELPIQAVHFQITTMATIIRTQPCEAQPGPNGGGNCVGALDSKHAGVCGEFHYFNGPPDGSNCPLVFQSTTATYPFPGAPGLLGELPGAVTSEPLRTAAPGTDASGVGDITIRGKYEVINGEKFVGSIGLGVRLPSGDAKNFLGTGAYGVTPFGALSYRSRLSPHLRIGYEWNSHSVLSGDPVSATTPSASLPPAFLYSGGVDLRATKRLTLAGDFIGQFVLDANRLSLSSYARLPQTDGTTVSSSTISVPSIFPGNSSYGSDAVAVGGKIRLWSQVVLIGNATIRVDNGGLRANVVPLVGLSWSR